MTRSAVEDDIEVHQGGMDLEHFLDRVNANVGGYTGVAQEFLRNAQGRGKASRVWVRAPATHHKDMVLEFIDDGVGMDFDGRDNFSSKLGRSSGEGTGHGARGSAFHMAKRLTVYTRPKDNPKVIYTWTATYEEFRRTIQTRSNVTWRKVSLSKDLFPAELATGTRIVISEFRNPSEYQGQDELRKIIEDKIRMLRSLRVFLNEKMVRPPKIDGLSLYNRKDFSLGTLVGLSVEILVPDLPDETLWIGHSTPLVKFEDFIRTLRVTRKALYDKIPEFLRRSAIRLAGTMCIPELEHYQVQGQSSLDPSFYHSKLCERFVEDLLIMEVAPSIRDPLAEYQRHSGTDRILDSVARVTAVVNRASGFAQTDSKPCKQGSDRQIDEGGITSLQVRPQRKEIGFGVELSIGVVNPPEDCVFEWDDHGSGLLVDRNGPIATVRSGDTRGVFNITVSVVGEPQLTAVSVITVAPPRGHNDDEWVRNKRKFRLCTTQTITIDHPREEDRRAMISVFEIGLSSGVYEWSVEGPIRIVEQVTATSVLVMHDGSDNLADGKVTATCKADSKQIASTRIICVRYDPLFDEDEEDTTESETAVMRRIRLDGTVYEVTVVNTDEVLYVLHHGRAEISIASSHPLYLKPESADVQDFAILNSLVRAHMDHMIRVGNFDPKEHDFSEMCTRKFGELMMLFVNSGK